MKSKPRLFGLLCLLGIVIMTGQNTRQIQAISDSIQE